MGYSIFVAVVCVLWSSNVIARNTSDILKNSGHDDPRPPVVMIPGIIASRLKAWKQKKCVATTIEIEDIVWLNLQKMVETMTYDKKCWLDCMKLGKNGTDPVDCKLRPDEGLSAIGELSPGNVFTPPGTSVYTNLIRTMSRELGYDSNNIIGAPYDWRLAPSQMEKRDSYFSTLKFKIESSVERHGRPAVVIAYSMGNNIFQYFMQWLKVVNRPEMGYNAWMRRYIWAYVGISAPLLGASAPVKSVLTGHTFGLPLNDAQARDLLLTCPSTHYLNPRSSQSINGSKDIHALEYIKPIITIKNINNSTTQQKSKSFDIHDIESGEIFQWIGTHYKESHLSAKYQDLLHLYNDDPVQPLKLTYRRPPVKHVYMIYGVDLPTEVAYSYQIQNSTTATSAAPSPIPASVSNGIADWLNILANITGHPMFNFSSTSPASTAAAVSTITSSPFYSDYLNNPLVLDETFFEDSGCHIANNKKSAALASIKNEASTKKLSGNLTPEGIIKDFFTGSSTPTSDTTEVSKLLLTPGEVTCQSELFAVKSVGNPLEFITNGGPILKRYVISNSNRSKDTVDADYLNVINQTHSGDTTVPYASLSHAKTWLNEESSGCEFNWSPDFATVVENAKQSSEELAATVLAMQERVLELNKKLKLFDDVVKAESEKDDIETTIIDADGSETANEEVIVKQPIKTLFKLTNAITSRINKEKQFNDSTPNALSDDTSKNDQCNGKAKQWSEKIPSRIHRHFLDDWGAPITMTSAIANMDPAIETFFSNHANGDTTAVMEVSGLDHLEIVKHSYVHEVMFRYLLEKMSEDLHLV